MYRFAAFWFDALFLSVVNLEPSSISQMLQRALAKENVAERQQQLFRAAGIKHYRQLAMRSSWDLAHAVDVSVQEMEVEYVVVGAMFRQVFSPPKAEQALLLQTAR